jgi:hypothetical protein
MIMGVRAFLIMVMMSMPMIVSMTIALVLGVVPRFITPPWHR